MHVGNDGESNELLHTVEGIEPQGRKEKKKGNAIKRWDEKEKKD